ncbi:MAG: amidohydrolase family protein [Chthoniobacterales bacterium]
MCATRSPARRAIELGVPPIIALQMGSINTARHYRLRNYGAIAPRFWADFVVLDDLEKFVVRQVLQKRPTGGGGRRLPRRASGGNLAAAEHDERPLRRAD